MASARTSAAVINLVHGNHRDRRPRETIRRYSSTFFNVLLRDPVEHDFGRIGQLPPPAVRATDRQPSTLSSPGTRISRSRDEVGVPSGSTPDDSIRQPSGVAVQSPVPFPPEASNDHERICRAFGSQPMICLPEDVAMPSLRIV